MIEDQLQAGTLSEVAVPLPRLMRTLWRIHHRQNTFPTRYGAFWTIAIPQMCRVKLLYKNMLVLCRFRDAAPSACIRQKEIGCFTYNPRAIMKVSYNRVFLPEGLPIVCYNRASFLRWIAFLYGFRN